MRTNTTGQFGRQCELACFQLFSDSHATGSEIVNEALNPVHTTYGAVRRRTLTYVDVRRRCNRARWFLWQRSHTLRRRTSTDAILRTNRALVAVRPRACIDARRRTQCDRGLVCYDILADWRSPSQSQFAKYHCPLTSIKLYCLAREACVCVRACVLVNISPRVVKV